MATVERKPRKKDSAMPGSTSATPLRYSPSFEKPEENEAETARALTETMLEISKTTCKDYGHAIRSVHAKSHGLLCGELRVLDNLPEPLAQGLFAKPGRFPVVLRLSTTPGDILDDSVSTPRGLAIKIVGAEGARLPGSEGDVTQDFVLVNGPAFQNSSGSKFLMNLKMLAKTTDIAQWPKKAVSAVMRGTEAFIEAFGGKSANVLGLGGQPETHILGETFYSQVPILYGAYMAKVAIAPVSPDLKNLTDQPLDVNGKPNGLREAVVDFFRAKGGEWELRVQLCIDLDTMPIEEPSIVWPEDQSPYRAVARIVVPPQNAWSKERSAVVDDAFSFSPWHGLAAHRPLGAIMRMRKQAYEASARFRRERDGAGLEEPHSLEDFPSLSPGPTPMRVSMAPGERASQESRSR